MRSIGGGVGGADVACSTLEAALGRTPCCNKTVMRFPNPNPMEGCSRRDHVVVPADPATQANLDDFLAHRPVITQGEQWFGKDNTPEGTLTTATATAATTTAGTTPGGVTFVREGHSRDGSGNGDNDSSNAGMEKDNLFALDEAAAGMTSGTSRKRAGADSSGGGGGGGTSSSTQSGSARPSTARAGERPSTAKGMRARKFEKVVDKDPEVIAEENLQIVFSDRSVAAWGHPNPRAVEARHALDLQRADDSDRMKSMIGHLQVMRKGKGEVSATPLPPTPPRPNHFVFFLKKKNSKRLMLGLCPPGQTGRTEHPASALSRSRTLLYLIVC